MPKFDLDALTDSVFHAALNTTHTIEPGQIFLEHSLTQGGSNASAQLHNRIKNALRAHNSDSAEPVAWDEVARDQARSKAAGLLKEKGWKPGDNFSVTAMLALMVEFAERAHTVTDRCGYPDCGCDFDAKCASPPAKEVEKRLKDLEKALRPFAEASEKYNAAWSNATGGQDHMEGEDNDMVSYLGALGDYVDMVPLSAFRAASAALTNRTPDDEVGNG